MSETATFSLRIDADADPVKESTAELEKFKTSMQKSQSAIQDYQKSMRLLRGSSDEVKAAKAQLRAAIELERGKLSQANLAVLKLGSSYDKLTRSQKKATEATNAGRKAITQIGGPVKGLLERFDGLQGLMPALASGWGLLAAGIAAGVAALALAGAAVADLTVKFTEWLLTTADANRNMRLTREAMTGSAKNAENLGNIIDWTRQKVALTTSELNKLAVENDRAFRGARISGKGMQDSFIAAANAAGAGRQDVASFFDEIISRGKQSGRVAIGFGDISRFRNAGIEMESVYKALGVNAQQAAMGTVVSTDKMAAALAQVSENRFADINGQKMLSLGQQWDLFKDRMMETTNQLAGQGGALDPLLKSIAKVGEQFDLSSASGGELNGAINEFGGALADAITQHLPDIKDFVKEVIHLSSQFLEGAAAVLKWSQSADGMMVIKAVLYAIAATVGVLVAAFVVLAAVVAAPFVLLAAVIYGVMKAWQWISNVDWGGLGHDIVEGIKNGLNAAWEGLKNAVTSVGQGIKDTFKKMLGIASPSTVFAEYGFQTAAGYQKGITQGAPAVQSATTAMASDAKAAATSPSSAAPAAAGGGGGGGVRVGTIENHFHISGGANAEQVKAELTSASFLSSFADSVRSVIQTQGSITTQVVPSGG